MFKIVYTFLFFLILFWEYAHFYCLMLMLCIPCTKIKQYTYGLNHLFGSQCLMSVATYVQCGIWDSPFCLAVHLYMVEVTKFTLTTERTSHLWLLTEVPFTFACLWHKLAITLTQSCISVEFAGHSIPECVTINMPKHWRNRYYHKQTNEPINSVWRKQSALIEAID